MSNQLQIDKWRFAPDTGILEQNDTSIRLELRAAALLAYLAATPGRVVSHSDIIDHVWDGRSVSPNSVAVVISDIRKAFKDDPKSPKILETLPKRGYRLIADVGPVASREPRSPARDDQPQKSKARWIWASLGAIFVLAIAVSVINSATQAAMPPSSVSVSATINETGDQNYDALSRSVRELLVLEITKYDRFLLSTKPETDIVITSKLILWDGHPSMSISAESALTGDVIWSGMASGPETLLPRQVKSEMAEFASEFQSSISQD